MSQSTHTVAAFAPEYWPAPHVTQSVAPPGEYVPAPESTHFDASAGEYLPEGQLVQVHVYLPTVMFQCMLQSGANGGYVSY